VALGILLLSFILILFGSFPFRLLLVSTTRCTNSSFLHDLYQEIDGRPLRTPDCKIIGTILVTTKPSNNVGEVENTGEGFTIISVICGWGEKKLGNFLRSWSLICGSLILEVLCKTKNIPSLSKYHQRPSYSASS